MSDAQERDGNRKRTDDEQDRNCKEDDMFVVKIGDVAIQDPPRLIQHS